MGIAYKISKAGRTLDLRDLRAASASSGFGTRFEDHRLYVVRNSDNKELGSISFLKSETAQPRLSVFSEINGDLLIAGVGEHSISSSDGGYISVTQKDEQGNPQYTIEFAEVSIVPSGDPVVPVRLEVVPPGAKQELSISRRTE